MTSTQIVLLALLAIVLVAIAIAVALATRRSALRRRFGPEYDRVVEEQDSRIAAERELVRRQRRHGELTLRTIEPAVRDRFIQRWQAVQAQFVDDPAGAVVAGDELVTQLVRERGYPTGDWDEESALLSVEHARTLASYRDAHDIFLRAQRREASTEDLRQALVHYRLLFADILGVAPPGTEAVAPAGTEVQPPARNPASAAQVGSTARERGGRPGYGEQSDPRIEERQRDRRTDDARGVRANDEHRHHARRERDMRGLDRGGVRPNDGRGDRSTDVRDARAER